MKKVDWKVVEAGGREWKFLVTSYRARDRNALNEYYIFLLKASPFRAGMQ